MPKDIAEYEIRLKDKLSPGLSNAKSKASELDTAMSKAGKTAQKQESVFAGMLKFNAFSLLADSALDFGRAIIGGGVALEQTRVQFKTLLKDGEKANEVIGRLQDFANVTPFESNEVLKAGKALTAFGTKTEELMPTLKAIGDISAGTGKDFNELATIYGKAQVAGTLYAEDINQLVEAGIPVMGEFAKSLGTTEDQVKKMASEGKLKFADLQTAFANLTENGGLFAGMMEEQSKTVGGLWSTLVGKFQVGAAGIGESLTSILAPMLRLAISLFDWITQNMQMIKQFAVILGTAAAAWGAYQLYVKAAVIQQAIFNAVLTANPIGLIITGVAALAAGMVYLYNKVASVRGVFWGLWEAIKQIGVNIKNYVTNIFTPFLEAWAKFKSGDYAGAALSLGKGALNLSPAGFALQMTNGISDAFSKGFDDGISDFEESQNKKKDKEQQSIGSFSAIAAANNASRLGGADVKGSKKASSSVGGVSSGRPTTINIEIGKLIETFNVMAENLNDSEIKIKEAVAKALVSAVNDANLSAQ